MNKEQLREQDANKANATALGWDKALAQEKANQEKIGATVQAAREAKPGRAYSPTGAALTEIERLQAQRDELLAACKAMVEWDDAHEGDVQPSQLIEQTRVAIARATEGGTGQ